MKRYAGILVAAAILTLLPGSLFAQGAAAKVRWRLDFKLLGKEKPDIYTYTNALQKSENYWYIYFSLTNEKSTNRESYVPTTYLDLIMHTAHGKLNEADVRKLDPKNAEHRGMYYLCIIPDPEVEHRIIRQITDTGDYNDGVFDEMVDKWKKEGQYLNISEIRRLGKLKPGQTVTGIAIFDNVDPHARQFNFLVTGYRDFIRIDGFKGGRQQTIETETMVYSYHFPGDPYSRERDVVEVLTPVPDKVPRTIGPISSKDTLEFLVDMMVEGVRQEKAAAKFRDQKPPKEEGEDAPPKRDLGLITPMDMRIAAMFLNHAVDGMAKDTRYRYQPQMNNEENEILKNETVVWKWHEWWTRNVHRVQYDEAKARFVLSDEKLPGELEER